MMLNSYHQRTIRTFCVRVADHFVDVNKMIKSVIEIPSIVFSPNGATHTSLGRRPRNGITRSNRGLKARTNATLVTRAGIIFVASRK